MRREIYAMWDKTAQDISGSLVVVRNVNEALRLFTDLAEQQDSLIGRYLKDHELHQLGYIETTDGFPALVQERKVILTGELLIQMKEETTNA